MHLDATLKYLSKLKFVYYSKKKLSFLVNLLFGLSFLFYAINRQKRDRVFLGYGAGRLKDWSNNVSIKCIINNTLAAIDRYTFPNSSPRYGNKNLSYPAHESIYTSTDGSTEDELDKSEDGSTHIGTNHFTTGTY